MGPPVRRGRARACAWASRGRSARSCSRAPAGATLPVHRRRHRHRTDPRDDPTSAAHGTAGPDAAALQRQDRRRLRLSARAWRDDWRTPDGGLDLRLHVTREAPEAWHGARGRITLDQLGPLVDDPATLCFVCGPETMVADVPRMLTELGIDRGGSGWRNGRRAMLSAESEAEY